MSTLQNNFYVNCEKDNYKFFLNKMAARMLLKEYNHKKYSSTVLPINEIREKIETLPNKYILPEKMGKEPGIYRATPSSKSKYVGETLQLCINGAKNKVVIETLKLCFNRRTRYIMFMNELYKRLHGCSANETEIKNYVEPIYRLKNGQFCNKNQMREEIRNNGKMYEIQTAGVQTPVYALENIKNIKAKIKKLPYILASLIAADALPLPYFNGWMKVTAEPTHIKNSITGFERPFCLKPNVWIDWMMEHYEYIIKKQMEIM